MLWYVDLVVSIEVAILEIMNITVKRNCIRMFLFYN
jgi:hypothetical protein